MIPGWLHHPRVLESLIAPAEFVGGSENRSHIQMFMERQRAAAGEQQRCQERGQAAEQQCLGGEHSQAGAAGIKGLSRSAGLSAGQGGLRIPG